MCSLCYRIGFSLSIKVKGGAIISSGLQWPTDIWKQYAALHKYNLYLTSMFFSAPLFIITNAEATGGEGMNWLMLQLCKILTGTQSKKQETTSVSIQIKHSDIWVNGQVDSRKGMFHSWTNRDRFLSFFFLLCQFVAPNTWIPAS